jgi:flagellar M-ring protein FliF
MLTRVSDMFRRAGNAFMAFSPGQKTVAMAAVIGVVVGGFFFSNWVSAPSYTPLFSNLATADASAIVDKLQSSNTPYQLTDGGNTILVPQSQVYDLRLKMSGAGLPAQKDSGYSLLDKQGVTTSEFQQQVTYQRAMEGELAKTISSIDGVQSAIVHLAVPEKSVFADEKQKTTAAVMLDLRAGSKLSTQQVQAVVNLVASSVPNLDTDSVTVADSSGAVLSAPGQSVGGANGTDTQTEATKSYQDRVASNLQAMLDRLVGPGHAVAQVTAQLNFDQTENTTQKYTDPKVPPIADNTTVEKYSGGASGGATGILGPDNVQAPAGTTNKSGAYEKSNVTRNNAIDSTVTKTKVAPGAVQRMNVAVMVDSTVAKGLDMTQLQNTLATAAGVDAKRGDAIAVTQMPFDQTTATDVKKEIAAAKSQEATKQYISYGRTAGLILVIAVMLFLAWRSSKKSARTAISRAELQRIDAERLALEAARTLALGGGGNRALEGGSNEPASDPSIAKKDEIAAMVDRQPDEVAQLLRGWLADRRA